MASSRSTSSAPSQSSLAPRRISFARISEPLEVPDLLALQTASFSWLIGSEDWRAENPGALCGLEEILAEISPIRDFSDTMSLEFREPKLMDCSKRSLQSVRNSSPLHEGHMNYEASMKTRKRVCCVQLFRWRKHGERSGNSGTCV